MEQGICPCCNFATFGRCDKHNLLFSKAQVRDSPKRLIFCITLSPGLILRCIDEFSAGCAGSGCDSTSLNARKRCKKFKPDSNVEWYPTVISKTEATYLKWAWHGRGLHYHSSTHLTTKYDPDLSTALRMLIAVFFYFCRILMCKQCRSVSFPGAANRLCELKGDVLAADNRNNNMSLSGFSFSHTHVEGKPVF